MTVSDNKRSDLFNQTSLAFSWAIRVAATLRLADLIASGVTHLEELAAQAGVNADALGRLLRYLINRGVFAEPKLGSFALTDAAFLLQDNYPQPLRAWLDLEGAGGRMERAWAGLLDAVRTGEPAYPKLYGRSFWEDLAANPALSDSFNSLMAAHAQVFKVGEALVAGYDWTGVRHVVDVGGGTGTLLAAILHAYPAIHGTLIDLPATASSARETFAAIGLADRCEVIEGNFFDLLPPGGDVYLLSFILRDWNDCEAQTILRRCAEAAGTSGRVLIREGVGSGGDSDLLMFVVLGSRERTLQEFGELAKASGMTLRSTYPLTADHYLLECVAQQSCLED